MAAMTDGGFGPPTSEDRRPWLWVAMIVSCAYSLMTLGARLMSKWNLLSCEDVMLAVAYVSLGRKGLKLD